MLTWCKLQQLTPTPQDNLKEWWVHARNTVVGKIRNRFDSLVMMVVWMIWRERNKRVFDKIAKSTSVLIELMKQEAKQWATASVGRFTLDLE